MLLTKYWPEVLAYRVPVHLLELSLKLRHRSDHFVQFRLETVRQFAQGLWFTVLRLTN